MAPFKKKIDKDNIEEFRDIQDDVIESDFVPYACHWDEHTIVTRNGEILQTVKISDNSARETAAEEADLRQCIRDALGASIGSTDYAIWIHTVRRKANLQTRGEFKRDFAGYLDRFWRERNDWEHKFINEVYITIVHEGERAPLFNLRSFARQIWPYHDIRKREKSLSRAAENLSEIANKIVQSLSMFGAKRLGIYRKGDTWYSELCSFLGKLVTLQDDELPLPQMNIAHYLTDYDVTFGFNAMEVRMRADGRRRFGSYITLKEYRELPFEALETILQMPAEFVISQCFIFADAAEATKEYTYQQKLFDVSSSSTLASRSGLKDIMAASKGNHTDYCKYQLGIFVLAESVRALDSNVYKTIATLNALGMVGLREDLMLEECYWAILPANFLFVKRLKYLNTSAMGGMVNLNNLPSGEAKGNHWGPAVSTFHTINRTPYFFNFHTGGNGHTTLIGPSDSGKKVLMNFLIAQSRKYDGKLFYFDKARLAEPFVRSIDGTYFDPCPKADERPYMQLALNPLRMKDTEDNRRFIADWLGMLVAGAGGHEQLLKEITADIMSRPQAERTLARCAEFIRSKQPEMADKLTPWLEGGKHAALFNGEDSLTLEGKVHGFEMGHLLENKELLEPVFAYLLHRVMQELDGKPAMLVLDEAWPLLELPSIASRLKRWLAELEQKNAMALLASEHIDDIKESPVNQALFASVATKIFLPDDTADPSYFDAFAVQPKDVAFLSAMNTEDRHFLVIKGDQSVVLEMDLSGMVDIVSVLSATSYHLQMMEKAIQSRGISPSQWMPKFLETI